MTQLGTERLRRAGPARPGVPTPRIPPGVLAAWGALVLNVLYFAQLRTVVPIEPVVGQLVTQGALVLALALALLANRRLALRPSLVLTLLMTLAVVSLMVSIHNQFVYGAIFRATRLVVFVAVLWLLTPWWGRRDMLLLRCHRRCLWVVLGVTVLGALIAPQMAFEFEGRLSGVLWPIPATQVGHYAATLLGTTVILWMCRVVTSGHALLAVAVTLVVLVLTHTRTALLATVVALALAGASLFVGHLRVRRTYALVAVLGTASFALFASQLLSWAMRGQTAEEAGQLTGRTKVWTAVLNHPRSRLEEVFGSGMSDLSFDGLPIDSNWVATYLDQGWFGVVLQGSVLLLLLLMAVTHVPGPQRAVALFLVIYVLVASFTETGLGTASTYLLDLAVAAALLAPPVPGRQP